MWNNPCRGIHQSERADLSVSQNSLTTSPNKHSLPTPPKTRHDYTFPQRVACVMLKIYLNCTYRDLEEWLLATDQVR